MDCEQAGTRTAHAQLRSGRHDNAKVTVTTPKRVQQAAKALHCNKRQRCDTLQWTAAATVYISQCNGWKSITADKHRTYQRLKTADHDESSAVTTPLFLVSEASTRCKARSSAHETN